MQLIGAGRIGQALHDAAAAAGIETTLIDREGPWEALDQPAGDPIVLCVRNNALDPVLERVPDHRRPDLVIVQNGALRDFLAERDLTGCTRGLLYFAVPTRGAPIDPGRTTWLTGPHAEPLVGFFAACGVHAEAVSPEAFADKELEKLAWLALFGPLCEKHDAPVGQIVANHRSEIAAHAAELHAVGRAAMDTQQPLDDLVEALCDYSLSIPTFRSGVKEWEWRNGWLLAAGARYGIGMPVHRGLLTELGHLPR